MKLDADNTNKSQCQQLWQPTNSENSHAVIDHGAMRAIANKI